MYTISKCVDDSLWDSLLARSKQSTPFCSSAYLNSTGQSDSRFIVTFRQKPVLLTVLTGGKSNLNNRDFSDYQGIMFIGPDSVSYSEDLRRLNHVKALLEFAMLNKETILFSLNPRIIDIRAFQWFAYDNSSEIEFNLKVRYAGIITLADYKNFEDFLTQINISRAKEFTAKKESINQVYGKLTDIDTFLEMYSATFAAQGLDIKQATLAKISSIISSALTYKYGELRFAQTLSNETIAGAFFLKFDKARYYQFGASSNLKNSYPGNSYLILNAIRDSFLDSHEYFDMSGLNSPNRGFFKASFSARPVPFYEIELRKKDPSIDQGLQLTHPPVDNLSSKTELSSRS